MHINPYVSALPATANPVAEKNRTGDVPSFGDLMKEMLHKVNDYQIKADEAVQQLVLGDTNNFHQTLIATEQAKLSLQLTVQLTNKVIEAYQEIARTQI